MWSPVSRSILGIALAPRALVEKPPSVCYRHEGCFIDAPCYGKILICPFHAKGEAIPHVLQKLAHLSPFSHAVMREWQAMFPLPCKDLAHNICAAYGKLHQQGLWKSQSHGFIQYSRCIGGHTNTYKGASLLALSQQGLERACTDCLPVGLWSWQGNLSCSKGFLGLFPRDVYLVHIRASPWPATSLLQAGQQVTARNLEHARQLLEMPLEFWITLSPSNVLHPDRKSVV